MADTHNANVQPHTEGVSNEAEGVVMLLRLVTFTKHEDLKMSDIVWSKDNETFNYDSINELLEYYDLNVGDKVYFGTKTTPSPKWVDANDVIEIIGERAYDEHGEYAEDFPIVSDAAIKELDDLLVAWQEKNCVAYFWAVRDSKEYTLTEKDLAE